MSKNFDIKSYQINDFLEWNDKTQLVLSPKFQRRRVWSKKAKSYLIDTILRELPMPPVFIRQIIDINTRRTIREVIDGQQRLAAILDYINDGFKVSRIHNESFSRKFYSQLAHKIREKFLEYEIPVNVITSQDDEDALKIFSRLNTYTVRLNDPEKLNAEFFGLFKQLVHDLAYEFNTFWVKSKILSETKIARMQDVDLTSELIIASISGIQDRNKIKSFYTKYEDTFSKRKKYRTNFQSCVDIIGEIYGETLPDSWFNSIPLFYTLYTTMYDLTIGLPKSRFKIRIKKSKYSKVRTALQDLDEDIENNVKKPNQASPKLRRFIYALRTHSTVLEERLFRHEFLISFIKKYL